MGQKPNLMSFRITLSDSPALVGNTQKRRVYRWGNMWGILTGSDWYVERRTLLSTTPMVEAVERLDIHAPPPHVDDIWEEEVVLKDGTEWNGLLSFTGTAQAVQNWYVKMTNKRLDVPLPHSEASVPRGQKQEHQKISRQTKCLIVDG
jgi:hypothetical protein